MSNRFTHIIPLVAAVVVLTVAGTGCRSHKNAAAAGTGTMPGESIAATLPAEPDAIPAVMALAASYSDWTDVQMPVRLELTSPKNFAVSGRATMIRGKALFISLRMLGLEVASIYADTDSVTVMEKLHKTAYVESLSRFTAASGMSLADIQDLLLGRAFAPGRGTLGRTNMDLFTTDTSLFDGNDGLTAISPADKGGVLKLIFAVDESPAKFPMARVTDAVAQVADRATIVVSYSDPAATQAGTVSADAAIATNLNNRRISAALHWDLSQARWNSAAQVSPRSTRGYKRVDTATLMKLLKGLAGR